MAEKTEVGERLRKLLADTRTSQGKLAETVGVSRPYINQMVNGERRAPAEWLDVIATGLKLSDQERVELHRAAARDHGFKIDLG